MFSNDEVINIDVGWSEADGIPISSRDLAARGPANIGPMLRS